MSNQIHEITVFDIYQNNKTQDLYTVLDFAINCTNEQDGQQMVVYTKYNKNGDIDKVFVREIAEFNNKFTFVRKGDYKCGL